MRPEDLKGKVAAAPLSRAELEALYLTLHERRTRFIADVMRLRHRSADGWLPDLRRAVLSFVRLYAANRRALRLLEAQPSRTMPRGR